MLIQDVMNSGARPVLTTVLQFAAARQRQIAHNIANLDTPRFTQMNASVKDFQESLRKSVALRRDSAGRTDVGTWVPPQTRDVRWNSAGGMNVEPRSASGGVMYHDRNNRDLERLMQDLAENGMQYRAAADFLRQHGDLMRVAITQRV